MGETRKLLKVIQTSKYTEDRLAEKGEYPVFENTAGQENLLVKVYEDVEYQTVEGFGGSFTEAASVTLDRMSREKREEILNAYFHPEKGLGYTLCRTHINSCDFSEGNYAYVEKEGDTALESFSIERDRISLIPFIKEAILTKGENIKILASPWSPPAWMKTNGKMNQGGKLKEEYREVWARYYARYIKEYAAEGIDIWAITVQNEPKAVQRWDSCIYTAEEERDFVKFYLGPTLEKEGVQKTRIVIWDHNKELVYDRAKTILSDAEAAKYIWGVGFHWYSGDHFETLDAVHRVYPDKFLIHTEGCVEGGEKMGLWEAGEKYGHDIIGDFTNWTTAWIDWNLILNEQGGPNHVGNYCDAPIIADTRKDTVTYESSFYYIGHFSKFVKPGAKRIGCSRYTSALETVAFKNPDGEIVVVVLNRSEETLPFTLQCGNELVKLESLPRSIMTLLY